MITFLGELVAHPTHESEAELQRYLQLSLRRLGFDTWMEDVYPGRPNLYGRRGKGGPLLTAHVDTFPPYAHPSPFVLQREGDKLIGRGVVDVKGQIAALFSALCDSASPCLVAFTADEERHGGGSLIMNPEVDGALVLEPTGLAVAVAQAGFIEACIGVTGRASHATLPERGDNAILKAVRLYARLMQLPFMQASHALFPPAWSSLGRVEGGHHPNAVPDYCRFQVDLAVIPGVDLADAERQLREAVEDMGAVLEITDLAPAYETDVAGPHVQTLLRAHETVLGQPATLTGMRSWTDAEHLVRKDIPCVVYGAGDLAVAHSSREEVAISELEKLAVVLAEFIARW